MGSTTCVSRSRLRQFRRLRRTEGLKKVYRPNRAGYLNAYVRRGTRLVGKVNISWMPGGRNNYFNGNGDYRKLTGPRAFLTRVNIDLGPGEMADGGEWL